jgi:hypothetical protein
MSDDKTKGARMTDDDRALAGLAQRRAATVSDGVPAPSIGADSTPLPMEPSPIAPGATLEEVRAYVMKQNNVLREQDIAIARIWDIRNLGDEVTRLSGILGGLAGLASVPELLRIQSSKIEVLIAGREAESKASDKRDKTIEALDRKIDELDKAFVQTNATISALSASITKQVDGVGDELAALEDRLDEEIEKLRAVVDEAGAKIATLERAHTIVKAWATLIGFLAGLAAWFLARWQSGQN